MSLNEAIRILRQNVERWHEEVSNGTARGTLLMGMAGKAAGSFETLLRKCLVHFLNLSGLDYESELAPDFRGKSLQKLTLGEVARSFYKLDTKLSLRLGRKDLLFSKAHKNRLDKITELRNQLHHNFDEKFAKNEAARKQNTRHLLSLILEELSEPFYQSTEDIQPSEID